MTDTPVEISKQEQAVNLLKQATEEIRQLRQTVQHQGAQLLIFEKVAKISGWVESQQGCSPDLVWQIERFMNPPRPAVHEVVEP